MDDLAAIRSSLDRLTGTVAALEKQLRGTNSAGRLMAEAIAAGDSADAERVVSMKEAIAALHAAVRDVGAKVDHLTVATKPAADYFAGRFAAEGAAEGEGKAAGKRLVAARNGMIATVLESPNVRAAVVSLIVAAFAGGLGLVTGVAGKAQAIYNGPAITGEADAVAPRP